MNKIALCAIGKNENNYIKEWIEHYKNLGFDHIFLYDNNSLKGEYFQDVIFEDIQSGFVEIIDARGEVAYQTTAYTECYHNNYMNYNWIAYFDIDEFLVLDPKYKNIHDFLSDKIFKNYNCIRICWKQYKDNDLIKVINNNYSVTRFTEHFPLNVRNISTQSKSIFRTVFDSNFTMTSPHGYWSKEVISCDTIGRPTINDVNLDIPTWEGACLNHYRFKTIEEYTLKMKRGWATLYGNAGVDLLNLKFFFHFNTKTTEKDEYAKYLLKDMTEKIIYINSWNLSNDSKIISNNLGDDLNYYFLPKIMPYRIVPYKNKGTLIRDYYKDKINYCFIGSVIQNNFINDNTIIWGAGIKRGQDYTYLKDMPRPKKVCAVRGPLTRQLLLEQDIDCPAIYGDPALLLSKYYYPKIEKQYKIGIIPHFKTIIDLQKFKQDDICIISMNNYSKWTDVVNKILSCENIVSESLHGLIIAESYGIPNLWIDIQLLRHENCEFKFHDFFNSIGQNREKPYQLNENLNTDEIYKELSKYKRTFDIDLDKLIESCPIELILPDVPINSRI